MSPYVCDTLFSFFLSPARPSRASAMMHVSQLYHDQLNINEFRRVYRFSSFRKNYRISRPVESVHRKDCFDSYASLRCVFVDFLWIAQPIDPRIFRPKENRHEGEQDGEVAVAGQTGNCGKKCTVTDTIRSSHLLCSLRYFQLDRRWVICGVSRLRTKMHKTGA